MKHLNNKNILKLFEVYETRHSIYLVLEVLKGGELIKKINVSHVVLYQNINAN